MGRRPIIPEPIRLDRRYALFVGALILLAGFPVVSGFVGLGWELPELAGLVGTILCVWLCGAPIRARDSSPPALLSLRSHRLIGWTALGIVALHVGGLVAADRNVVEYLKPSMPLYIAAGVLATLVLLISAMAAASPFRRRLWNNHRTFQAIHVITGGVLVSLIAVHVIATRRYTAGPVRRMLMLGVTVGAMLMLLRQRRPGKLSSSVADREHRWVFGRHSMRVAGALVGISCGLVALMLSADTVLREPLTSRTTSLVLDFPHPKHVQVNCLVCHHNFGDGTGFDNCIVCHKSARADLKVGIQAQFHAFCFECHRHAQAREVAHGPVAGCGACHRAPERGSSLPTGPSLTGR